MLLTVKALAKELSLSESRIRHYLAFKDSPAPVVVAKNIYQGKTPGMYDLEEFRKFYKAQLHKAKFRQPRYFKRLGLDK